MCGVLKKMRKWYIIVLISIYERFILINSGNKNSIQKSDCGEAYVLLLNNLKTAVMIDKSEKLQFEFAKKQESFYIKYYDMDLCRVI